MRYVLLAISLILVAAMLLITGCTQSNANPTNASSPPSSQVTALLKDVSTAEAVGIIDKNKANPDFVVLDVRTAEEFKSGHLANAIQMDYYAADFETQLGTLARNEQYLVYCRSGNRSGKTLEIMKKLGFTRAYNVTGGITKWVQDGYPTVLD